jgi:hypothetical protein
MHSLRALPSVETLNVIRNAQQVYVFPYTSSEHPKRDDAHMRLLDPSARDTLKRLLGVSRNWFEGFLDVVEPLGVRSVGVLFRSPADELVLFFDSVTIRGSFRRRSFYGGLEDKAREQLESWKQRYARLELQSK